MIEMRLRVHSTSRDEAGAWTLTMNSVALRWRVASELVAARRRQAAGPLPPRSGRRSARPPAWRTAWPSSCHRTGRGATGIVLTYSGAGHSPQARTPGTHCRRSSSMRDGSMCDGSMCDGSMRDGSMRDGSMRNSSMRDPAAALTWRFWR
jgi:hypothetical protein